MASQQKNNWKTIIGITIISVFIFIGVSNKLPIGTLFAQTNFLSDSVLSDIQLQQRERANQEALQQEAAKLQALQRQDAQQCNEEGGLGAGSTNPGGPINTMDSLGGFAGLEGADQVANQAVSRVVESATQGDLNHEDLLFSLYEVAESEGASPGNSGFVQQVGRVAQNSADSGRVDTAGFIDIFGNLTGLEGSALNNVAEILDSAGNGRFKPAPVSDFFSDILDLNNNQSGQLNTLLESISRGGAVAGDAVELVGSFTNLSSTSLNQFGNLLDQITSGEDIDIGNLSDFTGNVLNLTSNNQSILSGAGSLIQSAVNGNFDIAGATNFIGDLGGLEGDSLSLLGDAGSLIEGAFNGNFDIGEATDFIGDLGGLEGDSLSLLGDAGGLIQSAVNGNFDIAGATNFIGGLGGLSDGALERLGGAGSLIQGAINGNFDIAGAGEFLGGLANLGDGPLNSLLGNSGALGAVQDAFSGDLSFAGATEIISAIPGVGNIPFVSNFLGGSPLAGLIGGFTAVPVREVSGPLLSTTQSIDSNTASIDTTTQSIEELTIKICTYLKSIQRIQAANEQRATVEETELRRQAATEVEQYKQGVADLVDRGYNLGEGGEGPLYVENITQHINNVVLPEVEKVYFANLQNSNDSFKNETLASLQKNSQEATELGSTVSAEQYKKFINGEINSSDEFWKIWEEVNDSTKPNNPRTSFLLNSGSLALQKAEAEQNFRQELIAGQGFLPIRECVEEVENGACARWKIITPAIQVKETVEDVYSYRTNLYSDPQPGDIAPGNEPTVEELRTFTPSTSGGGGGSEGLGFNASSLLNILNLIRQNRQDALASRPEVLFRISIPPLSLIETPADNIATINWQTKNITSCQVGNDWINNAPNGSALTTTRTNGSNLSTEGSEVINLPLSADVSLIRVRNGETNTVSGATETKTNSSKLYEITSISMPEDVQEGDIFRINFWPPANQDYSVRIQIGSGGTAKSEMVNKFRQAINTATATTNQLLTQKEIFSRYDFSFNEKDGTITIQPKLPTYKITCVGDNNKIINEEVRITR